MDGAVLLEGEALGFEREPGGTGGGDCSGEGLLFCPEEPVGGDVQGGGEGVFWEEEEGTF